MSVLHSGTCGFSYRLFYCSTMFLPRSSAHCIKTTLSRDAHTGSVGLVVRARVRAHTRKVLMTSARPDEPVLIKVIFSPLNADALMAPFFHCSTKTQIFSVLCRYLSPPVHKSSARITDHCAKAKIGPDMKTDMTCAFNNGTQAATKADYTCDGSKHRLCLRPPPSPPVRQPACK